MLINSQYCSQVKEEVSDQLAAKCSVSDSLSLLHASADTTYLDKPFCIYIYIKGDKFRVL